MAHPWQGKAHKIDDYDLPRIGHMIGVGEDEIHAVLDVESRGTGFDEHGVIKLFEKHVFYRNLPLDQRDNAVALGIAHPKWIRDYDNNHQVFLQAYAFNKEAALKGCSWGLGQTLGENHVACGYKTVTQMVKAYADDEANQLEGMIQFIISNGLDDELREHDWAGFARGYNGKYYYKHNYHGRLKARFEWWQTKPDTPWSPEIAATEYYNADNDVKRHGEFDKPKPEKQIVTTTVVEKANGMLFASIIVAVGGILTGWWDGITSFVGGLF